MEEVEGPREVIALHRLRSGTSGGGGGEGGDGGE